MCQVDSSNVRPEVILIPEDVSNFFFGFNPVEDINLFCKHARFAVKAGEGWHVQHSESLIDWLTHLRGRFLDTLRTALSMPDPSCPAEPPFYDFWTDQAANAIRDSGNYSGMITCCACEEHGCSSQYAVIIDSEVYILFTIRAAELKEVSLYPGIIKLANKSLLTGKYSTESTTVTPS